MTPYGLSVTKQTVWHGVNEQFSNVYHFDFTGAIPSESGWDALIDAVVAKEKEMFGGNVAFMSSRVWGPTDAGPLASITRRIRDLSGTGSITPSVNMPPELAVVCSVFMGRNPSTQRKTFLRKFLHVKELPPGVGASAAMALGTAAFPTALKDYYTTRLNSLKTVTIGGVDNHLCKPNGDHIPLGTNWTCLDYAYTRQFKQ